MGARTDRDPLADHAHRCAWHDSRRERRSFPPRMAPPGRESGPTHRRSLHADIIPPVCLCLCPDLNCGCTYEEALFEESLARHAVGSYHPGESVRMVRLIIVLHDRYLHPLQDPALRNPLLKLLQWRFSYKDGDFERDPSTGGWVDGEGEQAWEARPTTGSANRRQRSSD
jgi:hypothetical protein